VRVELRHWLRRLHDDLGITSVFVTHDQEEAMEVADRVVILNHGHIEQVGTPEEVYERPANPFVYEFLGLSNSFHGDLRQDVLSAGLDVRITEHDMHVEKGAHAYVRPYDFEVTREAPAGQALAATLRHVQALGNVVRLQFELPGRADLIRVELDKPVFQNLKAAPGIQLHLRPKHVQIFLKDRKDEAAWLGQ
jgi:sulfate transport system ATP-binding protein